MDDVLERNLATARRLTVLSVAPAVLLIVWATIIAAALLSWVLALVLLVVGLGGGWYLLKDLRTAAPDLVVAATRAREVSAAEEPRLHNLVEGLCVGIGLAPPKLWIVADPAPNALSAAASVDDAHLVVTRGLLDRLSLVELEAVLAHELARIRRGEAIVGALAVLTLGGSTALRQIEGSGGARRRYAYPLAAAPVTRAIVGRGEPVESWSDLAAGEITRYPPGLVSALEALAADAPPMKAASPAVAHLWIHGPRPSGAFGEALARVYEAPPPVGQRIEVLEEL